MNREAPGFTIIELTIVLALVVVMMGLVVVRFNWGGPRQALSTEARKLGRLISTYREKAVDEERPYTLTLDVTEGRYVVTQSQGSRAQLAKPLTDVRLPKTIKIFSVSAQYKPLTSPITLNMDPHGVMADLQIKLSNDNGNIVSIRPDPLVNEVTYDER